MLKNVNGYQVYMDIWTPIIDDDTPFVSQKIIMIMMRMM